MIYRRVLVCGSRSWDDPDIIWANLYGLLEFSAHRWEDDDDEDDVPPLTVIHGGASGADTYAGTWALVERALVKCEVYHADWEKYGKAAGPIRNKQMLDEGKPDVVYAFTDNLEKSRGTANMVKQAKQAGLPVYVIGRA